MLRQNIFLNFILTENSLVFIVNFRKVIFLLEYILKIPLLIKISNKILKKIEVKLSLY